MERLSDRNRVPVLQQRWKNTLGQSEQRQSILQHWSLPRLDWEQLHSGNELKRWHEAPDPLARINIIICYFPAQILPQRDLRGLHQCSFASLRNSFSCNWEHPVCKQPSQGRFSAWNQVKNLFAVETQVVWTLPSWGRNFPYCTSHSPEKTSRGAEHLAELRLLHLPEVRCSTPRVWMCRWTSTQTRSVFVLLRKGWFFEQPRSPWAGQALSADQPMQTRSAHLKSQ